MHNQGRVIDYMDDYIAYLDYDGTKLIDGVLDSTDQHTCLHLFRCSECEKDIHVQIQEILL
ncbi:hypothetical protein [Aquibacillus albus]|nr:hypothetical protein [Aquibacillus albus]